MYIRIFLIVYFVHVCIILVIFVHMLLKNIPEIKFETWTIVSGYLSMFSIQHITFAGKRNFHLSFMYQKIMYLFPYCTESRKMTSIKTKVTAFFAHERSESAKTENYINVRIRRKQMTGLVAMCFNGKLGIGVEEALKL